MTRYRAAVNAMTRAAALMSVIAYVAVAITPCVDSPLGAEVARATGSAINLVQSVAAAPPASGERPAPFMLPRCPCNCAERPHAGGVPTAPGYALMRESRDLLPGASALRSVAAAEPLHNAPVAELDPIPV